MTELSYIGHVLTSKGVKPDPKKVCVIRNMEAPRNSEEVRRFLGHVNMSLIDVTRLNCSFSMEIHLHFVVTIPYILDVIMSCKMHILFKDN